MEKQIKNLENIISSLQKQIDDLKIDCYRKFSEGYDLGKKDVMSDIESIKGEHFRNGYQRAKFDIKKQLENMEFTIIIKQKEDKFVEVDKKCYDNRRPDIHKTIFHCVDKTCYDNRSNQ